MGRLRFKELSLDSFFGEFVYTRVVPRDHFLVKLNQLIDWDAFLPNLLPAYKGLPSKALRLTRPSSFSRCSCSRICLYRLSERQTEEFANLNLAAKEFA